MASRRSAPGLEFRQVRRAQILDSIAALNTERHRLNRRTSTNIAHKHRCLAHKTPSVSDEWILVAINAGGRTLALAPIQRYRLP